ncbi:MAG: GxxExxY protein [Candidatus Margulisbacteria bacterium]|jgi:GxxExxY protein|nr:GxxExxY protein [Candidatus Margulisiibacteriota bacterium]
MRDELNENNEELAKKIVHSAYLVHSALGPGLLESVYEHCFCHELEKQGLIVQRQMPVPINYDGLFFDAALRLDVIVEGTVICELKAVEHVLPVHSAQLLSYMKLKNARLGFLINFNVPMIKQGIRRFIL